MKSDYISSRLNPKEPKPPFDYERVNITRAFYNRDQISKYGKKIPGVYVFQDTTTGAMYVGAAVNLYNRVTSYFMPSIVKGQGRRVYRYFDKYGYETTNVTLFMLPKGTSVTDVIKLEQYFINLLNPDLNVDLVAGGSEGTHLPMSPEMREKLRLERGVSFFVYDTVVNGFIYKFASKQLAYTSISLHHKSLKSCLDTGNLYLGRFVFSTVELDQYPNDCELTLSDINHLLDEVRISHKVASHPNTKGIYAQNVLNPELSSTFVSLNAFANHVKGDRGSIRPYIDSENPKKGLYRNQ